MTKKQTGDPYATPGAPGGLMRARIGPVGMLMALGIVVIAYVSIGIFGGDTEPVPDDAPTLEPKLEHVGDGEMAVILPEDSKRRLEEELVAWFADPARVPISDDADVDEPEWVERILAPETWRRAQRLPNRVFSALSNVPAAYEDPGSARGTLVRVWGKVYSITERELPLTEGSRRSWIIELDDQNGAAWTVTAEEPPAEDIEAGNWVRAYGVFTKLWPWEGRPRPALHAFAVKPLVKSFAPVQHKEPRVEWMEMVQDLDLLDPMTRELEEEPFYGLLNYVRTLGREGYQELRDTDAITITDMTSTKGVKPLLENPPKHRFQAVRLRLRPKKETWGVENAPENPGNIEAVYRGYAYDEQPNIVFLVSPFAQERFDVHSARLIDVEGFFFKRRLVTGAQNGKNVWISVVVAASIKPVVLPEYGVDPKIIGSIILVGSVVLLAVFCYLVYSNKQDRAAFGRRYAARQEKKRLEGRSNP